MNVAERLLRVFMPMRRSAALGKTLLLQLETFQKDLASSLETSEALHRAILLAAETCESRLRECCDELRAIRDYGLSLHPGRGELGREDPRSAISLFRRMCLLAQEETIEIICSDMKTVVCELDHRKFLLRAVSDARQHGSILEFGVYSGTTLGWMAEAYPERHFIGFDSFNGLPELWTGYKTFDFDRAGIPPAMPSNVRLIIGAFEDTLKEYVNSKPEIALIHVDCDIYASANYVLQTLGELITIGTIIIFDEYFNYPGFQSHEYKACAEFLNRMNYEMEWLYLGGERVAGRVKSSTL